LAAVQTLHQQQKENPTKSAQPVGIADRDQEMIVALQSTLRVLQSERQKQAAEAARIAQAGQGKKSERESTSPVEMKSPKARRRKSRVG
jgi:hypothetical protein